MSRWMIEKDGTGIEKSGTGIEKSGTGIEKSGTGIEKSGTGIEKSGTGIHRALLACTLAALTFAGNIQAGGIKPAGSLQLVVQNNTVAVSWIIGDSIFSGISTLNGSHANLMLTEVSLSPTVADPFVTGGGTGRNTDVTGGGTGRSTQVTGGGTGRSTQVTGGGTGRSTQVTGGGTGRSTQVTGGGTGASTYVTGGGTGASTYVTGGGTGHSIFVTGGGTGAEAITITLPEGTGMAMDVSMGCGYATVSIVDSNFAEIISFPNVRVIGHSTSCGSGFGPGFRRNPGADFRLHN